jgi:hypothetical protein
VTVPIGAGDSALTPSEGSVGSVSGGATGISGMVNLTQSNVQASKAADIMGNGVLTNILGLVFEGLEQAVSLPLAIIEALVTALFDLLPGFTSVADALSHIVSVGAEVAGQVADAVASLITEIAHAITGVVGAGLDDIASFFKTLFTAFTGIANATVQDVQRIFTTVLNVITQIVETLGSGVEDILSFFTGILRLFGLGGHTGSTGASSPGAQLTQAQSFQQLLGYLDTSSTVPPSVLTALTPSGAKNALTDPNFDTGNFVQGQGQWVWDGWIGTGAFEGVNSAIRTARTDRITVYNIIGTTQGVFMFGGAPIGTGGNGQVLEYLRDPQYNFLVDWALTGTDPTFFEWINVPYPALEYPMGASVNTGAQWLINHINQTSGPFIFTMDSQGNQVGAAVYDELRFGSLQQHRGRLLAAVGLGNLRREAGHTFPGYPDPAPGSSGMCPVGLMSSGPYAGGGDPANPKIGNLVDTEDLWWDMCVAGDYYTCCPPQGAATVVPHADVIGGNVGDIPGIPAYSLRQFYAFINQSYANDTNIINDVIAWGGRYGFGGDIAILESFLGAVMQQINNLGGITSPHNSYFTATPFADRGDDRTFVQIGLDYINSKAAEAVADGLISPSILGTRHQLLGQRVSVQPYQVVTAGASVMWVNVAALGPAIIVGVNAYDADQNLIATVTVQECTISDPEPSSNWNWVDLKADFVMPTGAASACLVLNVEPEAMTTGIVWFDQCIFEPSTLIDAAWLDVTNIPILDAAKVAGPQGEADLLSAWQNLIDSLASAHTQTNISGVTLAQMLQSMGATALDASTSLQLGVSHQQILGNPATQPLWGGMTPSGQVTFPLPTGTLPTVSVASGTTLIGFINVDKPAKIGFVEFLAMGSSPSGVYLNAYLVDLTNGNQTNLWSSGDISSSIPSGSLGWVPISIPADDQFTVTAENLIAWEIVANSSTITVVAQTLNAPNKSYLIPPNIGAARTEVTTGGISPSSLTPSQLGYGGTAPFVVMSVSDLPPTYFPTSETPFLSPGLYKYTIPTRLAAGDYLDLVEVGGGGGAGWADGDQYTFLGLSFGSVNIGQGGEAASWGAKTVTLGTDVPSGVTELHAIIANGGSAPSGSGGQSIIGYGTLGTPAFDAAGSGANTDGSVLTWTHFAAAGSYLVVALNTRFGTFDVKCGTTPMVPLGLVYLAGTGPDGALALYGLPNMVAGTNTIHVTTGAVTWMTGTSLSFTGVSCAGLATPVTGVGTALSQDVTCGDNQIVLHAFGHQGFGELSAFAGGTHSFYDYNRSVPYFLAGLSVGYTSGNDTFTAKASVTDNWAGMSLVLNPSIEHVLLAADGGQSGGPGGASNYNPANSNTGSSGPGPGNQMWAGKLYPGGNATTTLAFPGNFPGGAGSGGTQAVNAIGIYPANSAGANGAAWIRARQGASAGTVIGGIGGGGGSELSVVYEAVGAGGAENTPSANSLSWSHTSSGGPNCAVVLIGAISYSAGAPSITCTYGSSQLTYTLAEYNYYLSTVALGIFAFGLIGVPSGTKSVSIGASGATINYLSGNSLTYQNVGSFGDFVVNKGQSTGLSLTGLDTASGSRLVGGFADISNVIGSFNQTSRWAQNATADIPMIIGDASGASSQIFTATTAVSDYWGGVGGILLPSA